MNLYIGAPGTGKTYLLQNMTLEKPNPIILAPTWYCANKINGITLYNYYEIFMFSKKEMERVLQCSTEDTEFFLFGDPYQIKPPNDDGYFWEALTIEPKITYLTKYYRSQDDKKLQQVLEDYRIQKKIKITNTFQLISIKEAINLNATILVGTHKAQEYIQNEINKLSQHTIYGPDGKQYRKDQILFSISKYGAIQEKLQLVRFDNDKMIVKKIDFSQRPGISTNTFYSIEPTKKQKLSYPVIFGDVLTVNIAQGQEFDKVIIDSSSFFEFGSLYTALSRTKKFDDIYIIKRGKFDKVFETDLQNPYCQ